MTPTFHPRLKPCSPSGGRSFAIVSILRQRRTTEFELLLGWQDIPGGQALGRHRARHLDRERCDPRLTRPGERTLAQARRDLHDVHVVKLAAIPVAVRHQVKLDGQVGLAQSAQAFTCSASTSGRSRSGLGERKLAQARSQRLLAPVHTRDPRA